MTRQSAGPVRPLTEAQARIASEVGRGFDAKEVAKRLGIETSTVRTHVNTIALLLPNPDRLGPYRLVMLWAAHERWVIEHHPPQKTA